LKKYLILVMIIVLSLSLTGCMDFLNVDSASKDYYDLRMEEPRGEGEVTPEEGRHRIEAGSTAPISAEAEDDWVFNEWRGGNVASEDSENTEVFMDDDVDIKAIFVEDIIREVTVASNISGAGSFTGEDEYNKGEDVEITVEENLGFEFEEWEVIEPEGLSLRSKEKNTTGFRMPGEDVKLEAQFQDVGSGDVVMDHEGSGSTSGEGEYTIGSSVDISAGPADNWTFENWKSDNDEVSFGSRRSEETYFKMPDTDEVEIMAVFEKYPHLEVKASHSDRGDVTGSGHYPPGEGVEITAEADDFYGFVEWDLIEGEGDIGDSSAKVTTFTMDDDGEDAKVEAVFQEEKPD